MTPRGGSEVYVPDGIVFIRSQNVTFTGLDLSDVAYIDAQTDRLMGSSRVLPFDVLLNITGASIGRCCFVPDWLADANQNQHVCTIRLLHPNWFDAKFLSTILSSPIGQSQIVRLNAGGNREGLNYQQLRSFVVVWPSSPERSKIAEILSTVDRAIEQTEALIAKYQRIKTGLIHDLLTHGIDENGSIRTEATHKFKDSLLGRIPAEWAVGTLERCVRADAPICYGILMPGRGHENGVPVIKVKDIMGGRILQNGLLLTDPRIDRQYRRSRLHSGDLLVTIRGTTGRVAVVPPELDGANITQDTARVRLAPGYSRRFFNFLLQSPALQDQISLHTIGQAVKGINIDDIKRLLVIIPSPEEQEAIADGLEAIDASIHISQDQLLKLQLTKTGLMQDLLTGKRRVSSLLSQPSEAVA